MILGVLLAAFIMVDAPTPDGRQGACDTAAFTKDFTCEKAVRKATWTVSGLGVFRAYVNGAEAGADDFLKPGLTHLEKRRHAFSYDVTDLLKPGRNVLAAEVSAGWWRDDVVRHPKRKLAKASAFTGTLKLEYADGTQAEVATDTSWRGAYHGNVTHAEIYWGETYDARVSEAWRTTPPTTWQAAKICEAFKGDVSPMEGTPIKLRHDLVLRPRSIYVWQGTEGATDEAYGKVKVRRRYVPGEKISLAEGETLVVDFGQNAAGVPAFTASAAAGVVLTGHPAEMLNDANGERSRGNDGPAGSAYIANYRTCRTVNTYVFAGRGEESYRTVFSFFGGRYFTFTATGNVVFSDISFVPAMSIAQADETGTITTGRDDLNQLISNCVWGMRSNYLSVPTDCPQRNERLGWAGDTQAFSGAAVYAADVYGFLSKWMTDMRDSQLGEDEPFPGSFRAVAPPGPAGVRGGLLGWADAGVIVPYRLWRQFGDTAVVKANWAAMNKFMDLLRKTEWRSPEDYRQCADWLSPDKYEAWRRGWGAKFAVGQPYWDGETEADERQLWDLLGACYHIWDLRMMQEMGRAIGATADLRRLAADETKAVARFRRLYLDHRGQLADRYRTMQTPILYPLMLGLFPSPEAENVAKADLARNLKRGEYRIGTGFLGTPILLDVVTDVLNEPALAYSVLLQQECPGWLYSVKQGATTIWERWNGYTKERGFGPVAMNSFNHYAYGAVMGWMYRAMAGIRPGEKGGYAEFVLAPKPDRRVGSCSASYRTRFGVVKSSWRYDAAGRLTGQFTVPAGTTAHVTLPTGEPMRDYGPGTYTYGQ